MSKMLDETKRCGYGMASPNILYELIDDPISTRIDLFHSIFPAVKQQIDDHK
jgi:hypothetical protein